jgi:hypothetical protein
VTTSSQPNYRGDRFPPEIISHTVWLYHRFGSNSNFGSLQKVQFTLGGCL